MNKDKIILRFTARMTPGQSAVSHADAGRRAGRCKAYGATNRSRGAAGKSRDTALWLWTGFFDVGANQKRCAAAMLWGVVYTLLTLSAMFGESEPAPCADLTLDWDDG